MRYTRTMRRSVGVALVFSVACRSFGTAPSPPNQNDGGTAADAALDANASHGDASTPPDNCGVTCAPGCTRYDFGDGSCPPPNWSFGGNGERKDCRDGALNLVATGTKDATATLQVQVPTKLVGLRIELRFTINAWFPQAGKVGTFLGGGSDLSNGILITATENAQQSYDLALCGVTGALDNPRLNTCEPLAVVTPGEEHVLALEWEGTTFTAAVDCTLESSRTVTPIVGQSTFRLRFGMQDGDPIDGKIRDVTLAFF